MRLPLPCVEWEVPCGFQNTFFECPPDHTVTVRIYGFTRNHAIRRAYRIRSRS